MKITKIDRHSNRLATALANLKAYPQRIDQTVTCNRLNAATLAAIPRSTPITKSN